MTKRFLTTQVASLRQTVSRRTNVKTQHAFRTAEISIHPNSTVAAARLHALFTFARASYTALSLVITPTPPPSHPLTPAVIGRKMLWGEDSASPTGRKIPFLISHTIKRCALTKRAYRWFAGQVALRRAQPTGISAVVCKVALRRAQLFALVCRPGCAQAIATYGTFRAGMSYEIQ